MEIREGDLYSDPVVPWPGHEACSEVVDLLLYIQVVNPPCEQVQVRLSFIPPEAKKDPRFLELAMDMNRYDLVHMLVTRYSLDVNTSFRHLDALTNEVLSPVIKAVKNKDLKMLQHLVYCLKADPNLPAFHYSALPMASSQLIQWPRTGHTPLKAAILDGDLTMVWNLVTKFHADVNLPSPKKVRMHQGAGYERPSIQVLQSHTPFMLAIERGDPEMVTLLLNLGANPFAAHGWTTDRKQKRLLTQSLRLAQMQFGQSHPEVINAILRMRDQPFLASPLPSQLERHLLSPASDLVTQLQATVHQQNVLISRLKKSLECCICIDVPPVSQKMYSCNNSHTLCQSCLSQVRQCPLCKQDFHVLTPIRSRLIEELIRELDQPDTSTLHHVT